MLRARCSRGACTNLSTTVLLMIVCCVVVFDCEIKRFKKSISVRRFLTYSCAFLAVDLLFVAEIPRNAATIKYRFLINQVSTLQSKRQHTQRAEQGSHTGNRSLCLIHAENMNYLTNKALRKEEARGTGEWFLHGKLTVTLLPLEVCMATRVNVWFLTCGVGVVCRCSSWLDFALVRHKTRQTHGVATFLRKNEFFFYRVWVIFFLPARVPIESVLRQLGPTPL